MKLSYRIISIGTLAAHPLRNEHDEVRTGHATTTLIQSDEANILVDPSLPAQAMLARLDERTDLKPQQITHIFMTSGDHLHRRALAMFENASWLMHEPERQDQLKLLASQLTEAQDAADQDLVDHLQRELQILEACDAAPDKVVAGVDLYPLPGVTVGTCGLLLPMPRATVVICGDAVATFEHLEQGKILPGCRDIDLAQESFREAIEIGDLLVLGRDNIAVNPLRRPAGI